MTNEEVEVFIQDNTQIEMNLKICVHHVAQIVGFHGIQIARYGVQIANVSSPAEVTLSLQAIRTPMKVLPSLPSISCNHAYKKNNMIFHCHTMCLIHPRIRLSL